MHNLTKIRIFRVILWLIYPLAWVLLYPVSLLKRKNEGYLFFFFDRYAMGGAQKVHIDILKSIEGEIKQVYFTRKSPDDAFKQSFYSLPHTTSRDIHFWCDNLLFRLFTVHFYAFYINRHATAHVFSSNSTFFYDMLPFLKRRIVTTELLHNFTYGKKGFEFFGLANNRYLNNRVVVDASTLENIKQQYVQYNVNGNYRDRLLLIEPGVGIPPGPLHKNFSLPLKILYAGRSGPQKRVWLVSRIAEYFITGRLPVEFHFAGQVSHELSTLTRKHAVIHGMVNNSDKMDELFLQSHVIILTSAYEGFPMVIKEGMVRGCIPIVTALEGNKSHLVQGKNALLIEAVTNEQEVVDQAIQHIKSLLQHRQLLQQLSLSAYTYGCEHFSKDHFMKAYRKLLMQTNSFTNAGSKPG